MSKAQPKSTPDLLRSLLESQFVTGIRNLPGVPGARDTLHKSIGHAVSFHNGLHARLVAPEAPIPNNTSPHPSPHPAAARLRPVSAPLPTTLNQHGNRHNMTPTSNPHQPPHNPLSSHSWVKPSETTQLPADPYAQYRTPQLPAHFSWPNMSNADLAHRAKAYDKEAATRAADADKKWLACAAENKEEADRQREEARQYWLNLYAGTPAKSRDRSVR
jgi:hypothetical protein